MANLNLEILTKKLIKPSKSTPNHLRKLKLSLFDQLAPKIYANIIYYYSGSGDDNHTAQRRNRLEKSLADALVHFYPLAGRFIQDDVAIDCRDQGAELWQARVSCKLSEFLSRAVDEIELADRLLPWEIPQAVDSPASPLLAIQVNSFDDGGIVVAVRISHVLADAFTTNLLMKTWSAATRDPIESSPSVSRFYHEIANVFPARSFSSLGFKSNHSIISAPPSISIEANKVVTERFLISSKILRNIKQKIRSYTGTGERQPSRVVVVLAALWKNLIGLSIAKHGHLKDSALSIAMNLRGKTPPGMINKTTKAFGNFYLSILVTFSANNYKASNDVDLYDLIFLVSNKIADTSAKAANASMEHLSTMFINSRKELKAKRDSDPGLDVYFCSSWYGALPVYETDFGLGKPIWVSISTQPAPGVCLMDSRDADAVELWVSLKETEMVIFKQHFHNFLSISNL